jgi:hypothetical protein
MDVAIMKTPKPIKTDWMSSFKNTIGISIKIKPKGGCALYLIHPNRKIRGNWKYGKSVLKSDRESGDE